MKQTTALFSFVALLALPLAASAQTTIAATPERAASTSSTFQGIPRAAENANGVSLVVWAESPNSIMGRRVGPNGEPLGQPFLIAASNTPSLLDVASNGLSWLVVYGSHDFSGQYVRTDGTLRGTPFPAGHAFATGYDSSLHWNGLRYVFVWDDTWATNQGSGVEYVGDYIEQTDGVVSPEFILEHRSAGPFQNLPRLDCSVSAGPTGKSLAVCRDDNVIFADIVSNDSVTGPFYVSTTGRMPRVAWSGVDWVIGWLEGSKLARASMNVNALVSPAYEAPMETGITTSNGTFRLATAPDGVMYAGGDNAVYAAKFDPAGHMTTGPTLLATAPTLRGASLAGGPSPLVTYINAAGRVAYRNLTEASQLPRRRVVR